MIFRVEWQRLQAFPIIPSALGIQLASFLDIRRPLLAYADHLLPSRFFADRRRVRTVPTLEGKGGRAFLFFEDKSEVFWPSQKFSEHARLTAGMERPLLNTRS